MMDYIIPSHTQTAILLGLDDLMIPKLPSIFEMNPSQAPLGRPKSGVNGATFAGDTEV